MPRRGTRLAGAPPVLAECWPVTSPREDCCMALQDAVPRLCRARVALASLVLAVAAVGTTAAPSLAATGTLQVTFNETTTPRTCPPGVPAGSFCYTGTGTGTLISPAIGTATEYFVGYALNGGCGPDHNVATLVTSRGDIFVVANGNTCGGVDQETYTVVGGTGMFQGASGTGSILGIETGLNPNGTISSHSTY